MSEVLKYRIDGLDCMCVGAAGAKRIAYILYPMDWLAKWIVPASQQYGVSMVQITGMDWQNVFSPWPHEGIPANTPDFKGESAAFLSRLINKVVPEVEKGMGLDAGVERDLVGVSMSGLFALWQWMQCDFFKSIISLSGSFWYPGFMDWMRTIHIPAKQGSAYFLLGKKEPHASVREFRCVGENTEAIVDLLSRAGIKTEFEWVPGDHFSNALPRLDRAFEHLYGTRQ